MKFNEKLVLNSYLLSLFKEFNAQIDLNPHQVQATLFAFKSPLSSGVILARDELIEELKKAKEQTVTTNELFTIQWEII